MRWYEYLILGLTSGLIGGLVWEWRHQFKEERRWKDQANQFEDYFKHLDKNRWDL